jgi:plastocyanin
MKKISFTVFTMTFLAGIAFHISLFAVTHTINVGNYSFNPSSLNVEVGDIVKWVWVGGSHTTTSSTIPSGAASWNEPINSSNQTYSYTVTVTGTFNYFCIFHQSMGMTGSFVATNVVPTLTVTPSSQSVAPISGTTDFSVTSNSAWSASSDVTWCSFTSSGSGNGTLTANYTENTSNSSRTATITISVTGITPVTVQVIQDGSTVSIPENNVISIRLFPNPAKDVVRVNIDNVSDNTRVFLVDMTGKNMIDRLVAGNNDFSLNVGNLPRGVYFVKIYSNNKMITRKLILAD